MQTNQLRRYPYGDAFIVETPHLDKFADRMYQQDQQDQARKRQEIDLVDKAMNEEIGTIRSVDRDEYMNKYQKYKQLKKELLFNSKLQRNPKEYDRVSQEAARAFADAKAFAGGSAELNDAYKGLAQGYIKNPNAYSDDATQRMNALRNTRFDEVRKSNLTDLSTYMYSGPKLEEIKATDEAKGKLSTRHTISKELPGGLETEVTEVQFYDSPGAIRGKLLSYAGDQRVAKSYAKQFANIPKERVQSVVERYNSMSSEEIELRTGKKERENLQITENMPAAEKFANYKAMEAFVDNNPVIGKPSRLQNRAAQKAEEENLWIRKLNMTEAMQNRLIERRAKFKGAKTEEEQDDILQDDITSIEEEAKENKPEFYYGEGETVKIYEIKNREDIKELFEVEVTEPGVQDAAGKKVKRKPDQVFIGEDGTVRATFFFKDKGGNVLTNAKGFPKVDKSLNQKITKEQFKAKYGKKMYGVTETNKSLKRGGGGAKTKRSAKDYMPK